MPSLDFAANLIDGYFGTVKQQQDKKQQNALDAAKFLVSTGRVRNYNDLVPLLGEAFGGDSKKLGKGKGDPHAILQQFLNPALQMAHQAGGQTAGGQQKPSFQPPPQSPLLSDAEMQQRDDTAQQHTSDINFEDFKRREKITEADRLALEKAKSHKGTADRQATQNQDGAWTIKVRDADGQVVYEQPANAPKQTGALAERTKELVARGVPEDRAGAVASMQLEKERATKIQQSGARLGAYLQMSRQALITNTERYDEMKAIAPYALAAKVQGIDLGLERMDLAKERQAFTEGKTAASADQASKIVQAATKTAATLAGKKSSILMGLGLEDDEATIRRNLIQELSGGEDPDKVEAAAKAKATPPAAKPPAAAKHAKGDIVVLKDGTRHKVLDVLPGGRLNLDPSPVK